MPVRLYPFRYVLHVLALSVLFYTPVGADPGPTLEQIMGPEQWIGQWPQDVVFVPGGDTLMYLRKGPNRGTEVVEIDSEGRKLATINTQSLPQEVSFIQSSGLFSWQSDIFIANPSRHRLTKSIASESSPRWISPTKLLYQSSDGPILADLTTSNREQLVNILLEDNPQKASPSFTESQQDRLFTVLKAREDYENSQKNTNEIPTIYLGKDQELVRAEISPNLSSIVIEARPTSKLQNDTMPRYLTRNGYISFDSLRLKAGTAPEDTSQLFLATLPNTILHPISLNTLKGWHHLKPIEVENISWSTNGRLALLLLSKDFKDRWLVEVDLDSAALKLIEHMHDPAWQSWDLCQFGWSRDGKFLWYQSEKTGYAHLYSWDGSSSKALTKGEFEVSSLKESPDGQYIYFRSNAKRPSSYDIYRVNYTGQLQKITDLGGVTSFDISSGSNQLALLHSTIDHPPEVYLQNLDSKAPPIRLTYTASKEFESISWTKPAIVQIPSTHAEIKIPAKLYSPPASIKSNGSAVVFIHGAGYMQNSDEAWSYYYHEFMFHTLLTRLGVTVLDMDYRASAGYGRSWRTAIYRQMGTPELQDLEDGVSYLVAKAGIDPNRIGVYGGSYGGFLTLMAMFKKPDLFACGAALRPVTDWAQYEHDYTARILNTPQIDPEAYRQSSPIEFAEGLKNPLLICHGLIDDNVVAQDSIRLAQRLIDLKKENWELALYPVESHAFTEAASWLDEYRRILKLFKQNLKF